MPVVIQNYGPISLHRKNPDVQSLECKRRHGKTHDRRPLASRSIGGLDSQVGVERGQKLKCLTTKAGGLKLQKGWKACTGVWGTQNEELAPSRINSLSLSKCRAVESVPFIRTVQNKENNDGYISINR